MLSHLQIGSANKIGTERRLETYRYLSLSQSQCKIIKRTFTAYRKRTRRREMVLDRNSIKASTIFSKNNNESIAADQSLDRD